MRRGARPMRARGLEAALLACAGLALGLCVAGYFGGLHPALWNADSQYLPKLYEDLVLDGGSLRDWHLAPAPYYLPDWPVYAVSHMLGGTPTRAIALFTVLQTALMGAGVWAVARAAGLRREAVAAAALSVVIWLALSVKTAVGFEMFVYPGHHTGSVVLALFILAAGLDLMGRESLPLRRPGACLGLGALAFAAGLSDTIILAWLVAPFGLALGVYTLRHARRRAVWSRSLVVGPVLLGGALLGAGAHAGLTPHASGQIGAPDFGRMVDGVSGLGAAWHTQYWAADPVASLVVAASGGLTALFALHWIVAGAPPRSARDLLGLLSLSICLAGAVTLAAHLAVSGLPLLRRQLTAVILLPVAFCVLAGAWRVSARPGRSPGTARAGAGAALGSALASLAAAAVHAAPFAAGPAQAEARRACDAAALARHGARFGIAEYWDAKSLEGAMAYDVEIAQYTPDLVPYRWVTTDRMYRPRYDFIVRDQPEPGRDADPDLAPITALNGPPPVVETCGARQYLIYPEGFLMPGADGGIYPFAACELPRAAAEPVDTDGTCRLQQMPQGGALSFGPYVFLPPGAYRFALRYRAPGDPGVRVGGWDRMSLGNRGEDPPGEKVFEAGDLMGTRGEPHTVTGRFQWLEAWRDQALELRVFAEPGGALELEGLVIEAVDAREPPR